MQIYRYIKRYYNDCAKDLFSFQSDMKEKMSVFLKSRNLYSEL